LKLALTGGLALITVMATAAAISQTDPWNAKTIAFVILGLLIVCAMGAASYYYHLHENDEDNEDAAPAVALLRNSPMGRTASSAQQVAPGPVRPFLKPPQLFTQGARHL